MHEGTTQLARSPLLLLDYAARIGMDRAELMTAASISAEKLADPDARISTASVLRLWSEVSERSTDPAVGLHSAMSVKAKQLGLLGHTMAFSSTLGEAFNRLVRYFHILSDSVQWVVSEAGDVATLTAKVPPALVALRHPVESGMALWVSIAREITGTNVNPVGIDLPTAMPESLTDYKRHFACPLYFNRPEPVLRYARRQMLLPTTTPDDTLIRYLDDLAAIQLDELNEGADDIVLQVRQELWSMLPGGRTDLWRTASELGVSARTLQRRLGERGTSFSTVLEDLRRDLADEFLKDRRLAVSEVAFLLGYSEPSAFQRAFRRWHGVSPRRIRTA